MPFDVINTGTTANDGTGDPLRTAFTKTNDNFGKAVEAATSATDGRVVVFDGATGNKVKNGAKAEADLVVGPASATADTVVLFDGTTGKLVKGGGKVNADLVVGPASATSGRVAVYNGTTGKLLQNGTKLETDLVTGPASVTADRMAVFNSTTGKVIKEAAFTESDVARLSQTQTFSGTKTFTAATTSFDGSVAARALSTLSAATHIPVFTANPESTTRTVVTRTPAQLIGDMGGVVGPASATDGRVAVFDQTSGKLLKNGAKAEADLVVGPASATDNSVAVFNGTTGKLLKDGAGTVTAGKFSPTANTVTGNGMYLPAANTVAFSTNGAERLRIDSSGNVGIGLTPTSRNNTRLQIVDGIGFPATQVVSTDANTLDDYEEGTWTPAVAGATSAGTGTYTTQIGYYTKIGNLVYYHLYIAQTNHTGTGNLTITGLPFTNANKTRNFPITSSVWFSNLLIPVNALQVVSYPGVNETRLFLEVTRDNATTAFIQIKTAFDVYITGVYQTT